MLISIWVDVHVLVFFFFQAEDGIRDLVRSRGLGDVYKRQDIDNASVNDVSDNTFTIQPIVSVDDLKSEIPEEYDLYQSYPNPFNPCLLYTSDAADERSSVDLGGRRIIKKKKNIENRGGNIYKTRMKDN